MGIKDYISMSLEVIRDFNVIITVIAMLLVVEFTRFVASSRRRVKRTKVRKSKMVKPAKPAKPAPEPEESSDEEEISE
ncbi:MAG: hypothetical protein J1E07_06505 [Treponema sp.]|nr:hypothetical protein [Treponema sp.]